MTSAATVPPGPAREITMAEIREDPLGFLQTMARDYGPISYHRTGSDQVFMVHDPELIGDVMMAGEFAFTKEGTPDDLMLTPLLGEGLLTVHGESWQLQRSMTQPMFHRRRIEAFAPMMVQEARALVSRWVSAGGAPLRVDHDLTGLTLTIVGRAVVGGDLSGIGRGFGRAVDAVNAYLSHGDPKDTPDTETVRRDAAAYPRAAATLDRIVRLLIEGRAATAEGADGDPGSADDLLAALLQNAVLSSTEVRDQVMTMIMAGHETTAKALTWALYLLARNPESLKHLHAELDAVLDGRDAEAGDLARLAYTRGVIQETLRLYPPIWVISRRAARDEVVAGFPVPKGSLVCASPWVVHHNSSHWPEPERFDPSRFVGGGVGSSSHTYIPFGAGPRQCIGRGFALMEAVLVLATIARELEFDLLPDHPVEVQALVTLRPRDGLLMTARAR